MSFNVEVPADAELWVQGQKTKQQGATRHFQSPPLAGGVDYKYQIKARWMANGKPIERTRTMSVRAGDRFTINMAESQSQTAPPPPIPTPASPPVP